MSPCYICGSRRIPPASTDQSRESSAASPHARRSVRSNSQLTGECLRNLAEQPHHLTVFVDEVLEQLVSGATYMSQTLRTYRASDLRCSDDSAPAGRKLAREQVVGAQKPEVAARKLDLAVIAAAELGDPSAEKGRRERVGACSDDGARKAAVAELLEFLAQVDGAYLRPEPASQQRVEEHLPHHRRGARADAPTRPRSLRLPRDPGSADQHAQARPRTRADVSLRYHVDTLDVEIHDNGTAVTRTEGHGRGLIGMRERVKAFGGSLAAGPHPAGGYAVAARFPLVEAAA